MKKNVSVVILFLSFTLPAVMLQAQSRLKLQLGYSVNQPTGSFKELVENTSYRGFMGDVLYEFNEQLGVGLGVSYADFYQKYPRAVYQTQDGDVSAVVSNSVQVLPIVAKVNYSFTKEGLVRPYAGVGAGVNFVNFDQYLGEFPVSRTVAKPALTGEAGVKFVIGASGRSGIHLGGHYNYLPFKTSGYDNVNSWGGHVGVFFPLR